MRDNQESVTNGQTDRRTNGRTDSQTSYKVIPMCRYASQATQKRGFNQYMFQFYSFQMLQSHYQYLQSPEGR